MTSFDGRVHRAPSKFATCFYRSVSPRAVHHRAPRSTAASPRAVHRSPRTQAVRFCSFAHLYLVQAWPSTLKFFFRRVSDAAYSRHCRLGRGGRALRKIKNNTSQSRQRLDSTSASPRRLVSAERPRRGRGAAATRLRGMSTSRPRRRRDAPPRNIRVAATAPTRLVSAEYQRRGRGRLVPTEYPRRGRGRLVPA